MSPILSCPVCPNMPLRGHLLQHGPATSRCPKCMGIWIDGNAYWEWLDAVGPRPIVAVGGATATADSGPAKRCPQCGKFLSRVRVGGEIAFHIDRCAACSGIWLDCHEWDVLQSHNLAEQLHMVFSDAWQARLASEDRQHARRQLLLAKIGPDDFNQLTRIAHWLEHHPHRRELLAYLLELLEKADSGKWPA